MKGLSLLEILILALILSILIGGIYPLLDAVNHIYSIDMVKLDLQQEARRAMQGMSEEIRQSNSSITIGSSGASIQFQLPINITAVPVTYCSPISYYLNNSQIIRKHPPTGANNTRVLANNIDGLELCCWNGGTCAMNCSGSNTLEIRLVARKTVMQKIFSFPLKEKVTLRNENP